MGLIASITDDPTEPHVRAIKEILAADVFEDVMGAMLREYVRLNVPDIELMAEVHDRLAKEKIISKINYRALWNS